MAHGAEIVSRLGFRDWALDRRTRFLCDRSDRRGWAAALIVNIIEGGTLEEDSAMPQPRARNRLRVRASYTGSGHLRNISGHGVLRESFRTPAGGPWNNITSIFMQPLPWGAHRRPTRPPPARPFCSPRNIWAPGGAEPIDPGVSGAIALERRRGLHVPGWSESESGHPILGLRKRVLNNDRVWFGRSPLPVCLLRSSRKREFHYHHWNPTREFPGDREFDRPGHASSLIASPDRAGRWRSGLVAGVFAPAAV